MVSNTMKETRLYFVLSVNFDKSTIFIGKCRSLWVGILPMFSNS